MEEMACLSWQISPNFCLRFGGRSKDRGRGGGGSNEPPREPAEREKAMYLTFTALPSYCSLVDRITFLPCSSSVPLPHSQLYFIFS
jgi:hypothetical protein